MGWLDPVRACNRGTTEPDFHRRLFGLCRLPVHRTRSVHRGGLCPAPTETAALRETLDGQTVFGPAKIRVVGTKATYAAPDLI